MVGGTGLEPVTSTV